jgi:hypothetical protein
MEKKKRERNQVKSTPKPRTTKERNTQRMSADDGRAADDDETSQSQWKTLESNPEVITEYVRELGVPSSWSVVDVISLDPSMRGLISSSCCAFIVLFPVSDIRRAREDRVLTTLEPDDKRVIFTKQQTQNACGTIAVVHAVCNNTDVIALRERSMLANFAAAAVAAPVEERTRLLAESKGLETAHASAASKSETDENAHRRDLHFLALVCRSGRLFELDGRNTGPIDHGECSQSQFIDRSCAVIAELMQMSTALYFSTMALVRNDADNDAAVQQLMEMGICESRDHAVAVLASCNNDVEAALRTLLGD